MLRPSVLYLSLFAVATFILTSCLKHDYPPFIYETIGMEIYNADNSGESPVFDVDSVPREAYSIELNLTMNLKDKTDADVNESPFVNEDQVIGFSITSPATFNGISPNQSLNQLFNYSSGSGTGGKITNDSYTGIFSGANRMQNGSSDQWLTKKYLLLMDPPVNPGNYAFIVSATFSDARILTDTINVKLY